MKSLGQDLRFALRMLRNSPGFTAVAVMSLALGIGACTTIFSVFNAILLRPLPFEAPDRLVRIREFNPERGRQRNPAMSTFLEWRKQNQSFEQIEVFGGSGATTLSGGGTAERVREQVVGPGLFALLGAKPVLGRDFLPEDVPFAGSEAVLISHGLWVNRFGADPNVLGKGFTLEGMARTVIGVMPSGFWISPWAKTDVWFAFNPANNRLSPNNRWLSALGRLKPGVTIEQAQAELDTIVRRAELAEGARDTGWRTKVTPLHEQMLGGYRNSLYLLLGAVGFVLLIACVNVANLLLARSAGRQKEFAVRASLGAGRLRLIRQLLTESTTLAVLGGALGVLVSLWGTELFVVLTPQWFARTDEIGIDTTVLGFTLAVSVLTGILFGLAPALRISKPDLNESLKEGGRQSGGATRQRSLSVLVVSEVTLALVLLIGAGLMINSFLRAQSVEQGFEPDNLLTVEILLEGPKYWNRVEGTELKRVTPQGALFFEQLLARVRSLPGVKSADIISRVPPMVGWPMQFRILGSASAPPNKQPVAGFNEISAGLFRTMGIPLLKGRYLTERDVESAPWVAVISESFARQFFPGEDPIGKLLHLSVHSGVLEHADHEEKPRQVVGVVGDVRSWGVYDPRPSIYAPYHQHLWKSFGNKYSIHLQKSLVIRTATNPMNLASAVRRIVAEIDKDQAVYDIMTMEDRLSENLGSWRFYMRLYGIFAGLAVILAAVGIYGVTSYSVGRRTHEFGIRMALGAQRGGVLKMVLREGFLLAGIGLTIGVAAAFGLTRLIANRLYGIEATDPLTFVTVSLTLLGVALLACYVPARRAAKVEPMDALRYE